MCGGAASSKSDPSQLCIDTMVQGEVETQVIETLSPDKTRFHSGDQRLRQMVTDMGMNIHEVTRFLESRGIIHRLKNTSNRQELQNNAILDMAIKRIQELLQEKRVQAD